MFRRAMICMAALMLAACAASASGPVCVSAPGIAVLADEQGRDLIENGRFESVFAVREGELFAAGDRSGYRLFDALGQPVTGETFGMINDAGDCLIFRRGDRFGAMNFSGGTIVEPVWTQLVCDGAGGFLALDGDPLDDQPDEIVHIDGEGEVRRTGVRVAGGLTDLRDGRMPFMASDGRFGAVDAAGACVIPARWRYIGSFSGGVAAAADDGGQGVLDAQGNAVVPMRYDWLDRGDTMIVGLDAESGIDVYAADGSKLLYSLPGAGLQAVLVGEYLAVADAAQTRLYDAGGALLCSASADAAYYPGLGGQFIVSDGAWGEPCQRLLGPDGAEIASGFQRLLPLDGGLYAWMRLPGVKYYSDDLGMLQTSWNYDELRWGLADSAGNRLTDAEYLEIRTLGADRFLLLTADEATLVGAGGAEIRRWPLTADEKSSSETGA